MRKSKLTRKRSGFTLIEMAVVLVIIGLILGAVSIGKDMQRNAEYKKIKQKFIDQWASAYNAYYEKYGVVVGDVQIGPTFAVGGSDNPADFYDVHDGDYSALSESLPPRVCVDDSTSAADGRNINTLLHTYFDEAGIRMPPGRAEGDESYYLYLDSNGNPMEIEVCFQWNLPETASNAGNVMVIIGLTPDLARMLDQMIDGKADACEGMFRQEALEDCEETDGEPGYVWDSDNTGLDESQVVRVIAHYKMNQ